MLYILTGPAVYQLLINLHNPALQLLRLLLALLISRSLALLVMTAGRAAVDCHSFTAASLS